MWASPPASYPTQRSPTTPTQPSTAMNPTGESLAARTQHMYYSPSRARMSSSGWCGSKDAFIFLSVDLQRIYTLTSLRLTGVGGSGHLRGHVTKMQLFYKVQFSLN